MTHSTASMVDGKDHRKCRHVDASEDVLGDPDVLALIRHAIQDGIDAQEAGRIPAEPP